MKRNILIATVATTALIAGGTATAFAGTDTTTATARTTPTKAKAETTTALDKAATATLEKTPGTITSAELDQHNDDDDESKTATWEMDVYGKDGKWHEVDVNAKTSKVTGTHTDADDDHAPKSSAINVNEAAAAALKARPGTLKSIDLDDDGKLSWEAEIKGKDGKWHELNVDAKTAKVTHDQPDTDDDNDDSDD
ncbi:PepSY domain-containing protein [Streptomyces sp. H27-C3]|uniref:PepSY domain-containing protein n=1 Tax=Streptomyces sp. H27-C3 TaxID=3046305 RepID=UPI0024B89559|nr:PepSY domain-containing protein [Streptomyces sp. H27-C3]MDJ0462292.1 PepSY domain-containing protein [Streptomyces sp. H27-C3]